MPTSVPDPLALDAPRLAEWHQLHQAAMARMSDLANALDRQGWSDVDLACRWLHAEFRPHNEGEERDLLPLLERLGARDLGRQLSADHREMGVLTQALLHGHAGGQVPEPGRHGERARRLLDLVRQHIDTEEHRMLPLLQGLPHPATAPAAGAGYATTMRFNLHPAAVPGISPVRSAAASGCPGCEPPGTCSGSAPDRPAGAAPG